MVRPLPPRRHLRAARQARRGLPRELARAAAPLRRLAEGDRPAPDAGDRAEGRPEGDRRRPVASGSRSPRLRRPTEVFGSPTVRRDRERHRRLVADRRRAQRAHPGRQGDRRRGRRRPDPPGQADLPDLALGPGDVPPAGLALTLTLGSSSLAQNPANLLYLDLPFPPGARLAVTAATVRIPELATPISG